MTGAQSGPMGTDARGSDPMVGDESEGPITQISLGVGSVFGSIVVECVASVAGSIHTSSDGMIYSGSKDGVATGVISRTPSDGRAKSCLSRLCGAPDMGSNLSKIKSPRMLAVSFKFLNLT